MTITLFNLWFALTCSDAVAALLATALMFRLRTRFGRYAGFVMFGFAVESTLAGLSLLLLFPQEVHVMPAFAIVRSIGRGFKSIVVWMLVLYLLGFFNGAAGDIHETTTRKDSEP